MWRLCNRDNGKEHGNYYVVYWDILGYIAEMKKKVESTISYIGGGGGWVYRENGK